MSMIYQGGHPLKSSGGGFKMYKTQHVTKLGSGGYGTAELLELTPPISNPAVALKDCRYIVRKKPHRDESSKRHLKEEARLLREISCWTDAHNHRHSYITKVIAGGEDFVDMEYGMGGPARKLPGGPYTEKQAIRFLGQMLDALAFIHEKLSIIHCDIKPDNICISKLHADRTGDYILIDFGVAQQRKKGRAYEIKAVDWVGTPGYMAPELYQDAYGASCDVWSLGVTACELMLGKGPWTRESYGTNEAAQEPYDVRNTLLNVYSYMEAGPKQTLFYHVLVHMLHIDGEERSTARRCHALLGCQGPLVTDSLRLLPDATGHKPAAEHHRGKEDIEKREKEKREKEKREKEKREKEKREMERREKEKREMERREKEKREKEKRDREKRDREKRDKEKHDREKRHNEKHGRDRRRQS